MSITVTATIGHTGQMIGFLLDSGNTFYFSKASDPTIRIKPFNGQYGSPIALTGAIVCANMPMVVYPLSVTILSTDSVIFDAPVGWVTGKPFGGSAISASAAVSQAVTNKTGADMFTVGVPATLRLGINQYGPISNFPSQMFRNLAKNSSSGGNWAGTVTVVDTYGNPTTMTAGVGYRGIYGKGVKDSQSANPLGSPGTQGTYRCVWDDYGAKVGQLAIAIVVRGGTGASGSRGALAER